MRRAVSENNRSSRKHGAGNLSNGQHAAKKSATLKKAVVKGGKSKENYSRELTPELLVNAYRHMLRSRFCDEKSIVLYKQNKCLFQIGCSGHEAVQVAAAAVFRPGHDWFYPYYRGMAICAALGMTNEEIMLNIMSKQDDPSSHGRQMPMHYGHKELRIVNQLALTGEAVMKRLTGVVVW